MVLYQGLSGPILHTILTEHHNNRVYPLVRCHVTKQKSLTKSIKVIMFFKVLSRVRHVHKKLFLPALPPERSHTNKHYWTKRSSREPEVRMIVSKIIRIILL
jgi:hypothetical protein